MSDTGCTICGYDKYVCQQTVPVHDFTPPAHAQDSGTLGKLVAVSPELLIEAAEEIEAGIQERYGADPHPAYERKIERDMELPRQLRALASDE